jgi:hypothetical protein
MSRLGKLNPRNVWFRVDCRGKEVVLSWKIVLGEENNGAGFNCQQTAIFPYMVIKDGRVETTMRDISDFADYGEILHI